MSEKKPEYVIRFANFKELEGKLNELAGEGYELTHYWESEKEECSSFVMRLRLDAQLMPRMDELLALAQQIRNERVDLEARVKALEFLVKSQTEMVNREFSDRIKGLESHNVELYRSKVHVDDFIALEGRVHRAQETVASIDGRLAGVQERVRRLEADLERYQDTHVETHRYLDTRAREFGEVDATLLRASEKQQGRLDALERRLAALEAGGACGGVWRKSNAD